MLSLKEFRSLDADLQAQVLWLDGVYLELARQAGSITVELYSLFNYYVEIYFDSLTDEPLYFEAFGDVSRLEPYLEMIGISELVDL